MATLTVSTTTDYSGTFLFNIDTLDFTAAATALFGGSQFGGGQISHALAVDGSAGPNRIIVDSGLGGFDASGWSFTNWQANDRLVINGSDFAEDLIGTSRNDVIRGHGGSDTIHGGAGNDLVEGGPGADKLFGGTGNDWLSYEASGAAVSINLSTGRVNGGDAMGDSVSGFENLRGSGWGDVLSGSAGANRIEGGRGADILTGSGGADRFVYKGIADSASDAQDLITDFSQTQGDRIDLSAIDARSLSPHIDNAFHFVGTGGLERAGDLHYVQGLWTTTVEGDIDGDGLADFAITLNGAIALTGADFIL